MAIAEYSTQTYKVKRNIFSEKGDFEDMDIQSLGILSNIATQNSANAIANKENSQSFSKFSQK